MPFAVEKSAETKFRAPGDAVIPLTSFALLFSDTSPIVSSSTKSPFWSYTLMHEAVLRSVLELSVRFVKIYVAVPSAGSEGPTKLTDCVRGSLSATCVAVQIIS